MSDDHFDPESATTKHAEADDFTTDSGTALGVTLLVALVTAGYVSLIRGFEEVSFLEEMLPFLGDTVGRSLVWVGAYFLVHIVGTRVGPTVETFDQQSTASTVGRLVAVTAGTAFVIGATLELTAGALDRSVYFWFGGGGVTLAGLVTWFVLVRAPPLDRWVSRAESLGVVVVFGVVILVAVWWESTNATWGFYVALTRWVFAPIVFLSFAVYYLVAFADASDRVDGNGVVALSLAALVALTESYRGPTDFLGLIETEDEQADDADDADTAA